MREEGYYKVKYKGQWEVSKLVLYGYWNDEKWYLFGIRHPMKYSDFDEIGDKIEF